MAKPSVRKGLVSLLATLLIGVVSSGSAMAGKPDNKGGGKGKNELPPVGDSVGVIYFWDQIEPEGDLGGVVKVNWDGTGYQPLFGGVNNASIVTNWDVSHFNLPRFFIYYISSLDADERGPGLYVDVEQGGQKRKIQGDTEFWGSRPALSQGDAKVAFLGIQGGTYDRGIYVADLVYDEFGLPTAVANVVQVAFIESNTRLPTWITWSPDGDAIAFDDQPSPGAKTDIFKVELTYDENGNLISVGDPVNITNSPTVYEVEPAWSPWLDDAFTSRIAFRAGGIHTILPDGTEPVLAVSKQNSGARDNYVPAWSPEGGQIAFDAWGRKGETLVRSAADGSTTGARAADAYGWLRRIHWRHELP